MTFTEIIRQIERRTNTQSATTSSYPLSDKTLDVNNALNCFFVKANIAAGNWRPADDTNHEDYPIIYANLVANQQDYAFVLDEEGNQIMDIYKVRILLPNGIDWATLDQIGVDESPDDYLNTTQTGVPSRYFINSNGLFFDVLPNYSWREIQEGQRGIEIFISRSPNYFTTADTTKKAGLPWIFHEYLVLKPSYMYCNDKGLPQAAALKELLYGQDGKSGMEGEIKRHFRDRNHDFPARITSEAVNSV